MVKVYVEPSLPDALVYPCQYMYCGGNLKFERGRGWVHKEGGLYMMRCKSCDWEGALYPSPITCPKCDGDTYDDHVARPRPAE